MRGATILSGVCGAVAVAGLTAVALLPGRSAQAAGGTISVAPASQNVEVGTASFEVDVNVSGASGLASWEAQLEFDPDVLELLDVQRGDFGADVSSAQCLRSPNPETKRAIYGCNIPGQTTNASGSGTIATFIFRPKKEGTSALAADYSGATDNFGNNLYLPVSSGVVQVVAQGQDQEPLQPTPTPRARRTPTADERDPFVRDGSGSSRGSTSGGATSGGSTSGGGLTAGPGAQNPGGTVAGAQGSPAGSGVRLPSGDSSSGSGLPGTVGAGAPVAGTGPQQEDGSDGYIIGAYALLLGGAVAFTTGRQLKKRAR